MVVAHHIHDEMFADRMLVGKEVVRQKLGDYEFVGSFQTLLLGEAASTKEGNLHGRKIAGSEDRSARDLTLTFGQRGLLGNRRDFIAAISLPRNNVDQRRRRSSGQGTQPY